MYLKFLLREIKIDPAETPFWCYTQKNRYTKSMWIIFSVPQQCAISKLLAPTSWWTEKVMLIFFFSWISSPRSWTEQKNNFTLFIFRWTICEVQTELNSSRAGWSMIRTGKILPWWTRSSPIRLIRRSCTNLHMWLQKVH